MPKKNTSSLKSKPFKPKKTPLLSSVPNSTNSKVISFKFSSLPLCGDRYISNDNASIVRCNPIKSDRYISNYNTPLDRCNPIKSDRYILNGNTQLDSSNPIKDDRYSRYFSNDNTVSNRYNTLKNNRCFSNDNVLLDRYDLKSSDHYSSNSDRYNSNGSDRYFSTDEDDDGKPVQRNAANARERARMRILSKAFFRLKTTLPWVPKDTKLSKLDTLRLATSYILHLKLLLTQDTGREELPRVLNVNWPFGFQPQDNVDKTDIL